LLPSLLYPKQGLSCISFYNGISIIMKLELFIYWAVSFRQKPCIMM
jgi:hypothetical protein